MLAYQETKPASSSQGARRQGQIKMLMKPTTILGTRNEDSKKVVSHLSGKQMSWCTVKSFPGHRGYTSLVDWFFYIFWAVRTTPVDFTSMLLMSWSLGLWNCMAPHTKPARNDLWLVLVAELHLGMVWEDVILVVPDLNQAVNYCNTYQCRQLNSRLEIFAVLFSFQIK